MSAASGQIASRKIGFLLQFFGITAVNENGPAAGGMTTIHVPPAVTDHPALREVNAQFARRAQQHAGFWFAAVTVATNPCRDDNRLPRGQAAAAGTFPHGWFRPLPVSTCRGQRPAGWWRPRAESRPAFKRGRPPAPRDEFQIRSSWSAHTEMPSCSNARLMTPSRSRKTARDPFRLHFVDSHLVWATLSLGWETNKCQTTA